MVYNSIVMEVINIYYERLKEKREERDLSLFKLSQLTGIPKSTLQRYENGTTKKIPIEAVSLIEKALGLPTGYLMGWESDTFSDISNVYIPEFKSVPLLGQIACGEPILADENIIDYVRIENDVKCDFALLCKGDSMINARIFDGDVVYIRKQENVENGEIAAVLIDNEATLKRIYKYDNRLELRAENPTFPPINIEGKQLETVKIIGKAVAFTSYVK